MWDSVWALPEWFAGWGARKLERIFNDGGSDFYWLYILTFLVMASAIYAVERWRGRAKEGGLLAFLFPKHIYTHPSALTDLKLYTVARIISPMRFIAPVLSVPIVATAIAGALTNALGESGGALPVAWWSIALFTLGISMMSDLGAYITHRLGHEVPLFWEFHKVHHSAEVLMPVTGHRMHPLYIAIDSSISIVLAGLFQGVFVYIVAGEMPLAELFGFNVVSALFLAFGYHLRHSHVWLNWGPWFSRIIVSPAMHQIHHSYLPHHLNKNYAVIFALWDWIGGSLYIPQKREEVRLGLGEGVEQPHPTLVAAYVEPFVGAWRLLRAGPGAALGFRSETPVKQETTAP